MATLAQVLPCNTHLQTIDLRNNEGVSDVGLRALADALPLCGVVVVRLDGTSPWIAYQKGRGARATVKLLKCWLSDHAPKETNTEVDEAGNDSAVTNATPASSGRGEHAREPMKLIVAAAEGSQAEVKRLLERMDNDRACADSEGRTALWHAARNGHACVVSTLLQGGGTDSEHERWDNYGVTPLIVAAAHGHVAVADVLLEAGANGRAADQSGRTPLVAASRLAAEYPHSRWGSSAGVQRVQNACVGNACRRIGKNDPELVRLNWSADDSAMCGTIDDSTVRALANAISAGASVASATSRTARAGHRDHSASHSGRSCARSLIPPLRDIDLRGSRQITDASLALLLQALSTAGHNCGVRTMLFVLWVALILNICLENNLFFLNIRTTDLLDGAGN